MNSVLEVKVESDEELMVTAPTSPVRVHVPRKLTLQEYYTRRSSPSGSKPVDVETCPLTVCSSSQLIGTQPPTRRKAPRVNRRVSEETQKKISKARGSAQNRKCGVCDAVSTGRRAHAIHVASHFTRFMCDCGHVEVSYKNLLKHHAKHQDVQTPVHEMSLDMLEGCEPRLEELSSEITSLKKLEARLQRKIKAKEDRRAMAANHLKV